MSDEERGLLADATATTLKAFNMARIRGKQDWHRMTLAVLKNRLNNVTAGKFDEKEFGFDHFRDFVLALREIVSVDGHHVELTREARSTVEAMVGSTEQNALRGKQIRRDLWRAVLDFSSRSYAWDPDSEEVVAAKPGEENVLVLPKLSSDVLVQARVAFANAHSATASSVERDAIARWRDQRLPSRSLPANLQLLWSDDLKERVLSLLTEWFHQQKLQTPPLFLDERLEPEKDEVGQLRDVVLTCVRHMTGQELMELRLPAAAIVRSRLVKPR